MRPCVRYLLAGLLGGFVAALMLAATTWSLDLAGSFAAVGLADVALGVLGFVLSTLTAIAGALVVADARTDVDAARAWQRINAEVTRVSSPVDMAPASSFDVLYAVGPQDECLRRILLAHRFDVPLSAPNDTTQSAPARAGATAVDGLNGTCTDTELPTGNAHVAVTLLDAVTNPDRALGSRAPRLIASNANRQERCCNSSDIGRRGLPLAKRTAPETRLVANAGPWWDWRVRGSLAFHHGPGSSLSTGVIVLAADRNGRDHNQTLPDFASDAAAPTQPGCRGPPTDGSRRLAASDLASDQGAVDKRHRPRTDSSMAPADLVVIDNLGDRVPVGAAELNVVETYFDDVLRDLLAAVASGQDTKTS